ncbi:MAG: CtkA family protein, partial [Oscillospiraceae bacterium]|nr:CtkA family protein [Oscillospiraceae bacterium]
RTDEVTLAPVFDCGSCLFPQADEAIMRAVLDDPAERQLRIFDRPLSAIRENGQKINYRTFISSLKNADCNAALKRITPKLTLSAIEDLINDTPFIGDLQKEFYRTMLAERKEKILDYSLQKLRAREKKRDRGAR